MGKEQRYYNQYMAMLDGMAEWGSPVSTSGIDPNDTSTWSSHLETLEINLPGKWQEYINNPEKAIADVPSFDNAIALALAAELYKQLALNDKKLTKSIAGVPDRKQDSVAMQRKRRQRTRSEKKKSNALPILGIVISLFGLIFMGILLGPVGIIFGIIGLKSKLNRRLCIASIVFGIFAFISNFVFLNFIL
ncbi:MAG: hypothetical protein ACTSWN_04520 [Promethearchaeota archaeon]